MSKALPAESIKKTISYLYLLSFCPPKLLADFKRNSTKLLEELTRQGELKEKEYLTQALPEACLRIVAFHQATREPDTELVEALTESARYAGKNPKTLATFQTQMNRIAVLPGRAKPENRLHRNKGCFYCTAPCRYGYFTLVTDPQFNQLPGLFMIESGKPASEQTPLMPAYIFTVNHMLKVFGAQDGFCEGRHLANMAFCLLMLAMAKSRLVFPETQVRLFQEANQEFLRRHEG